MEMQGLDHMHVKFSVSEASPSPIHMQEEDPPHFLHVPTLLLYLEVSTISLPSLHFQLRSVLSLQAFLSSEVGKCRLYIPRQATLLIVAAGCTSIDSSRDRLTCSRCQLCRCSLTGGTPISQNPSYGTRLGACPDVPSSSGQNS